MTKSPEFFSPSRIVGRLDAFVRLYERVYAEPPYEETAQDAASFGDRLVDETRRSGFALVALSTEEELIGFAHGFTFGPDRWWRAADRVPEEVRGQFKFAVMELVVGPEHRGQGHASALMRLLLADRFEQFATLCTNPDSEARAIYRHWSWKQVGRTPHRPMFPSMDVLLLRLEIPR